MDDGNTCIVQGCGRPTHGQGLCSPHYIRLTRTGDVRADVPIRIIRPTVKRVSGQTVFDTFWAHVNKNGPVVSTELGNCWLWMRSKDPTTGYGKLHVKGRTRRAHIVAWELHYGTPVPDGKLLRHKCHTRLCCRPDHLLPGNHRDNANDASKARRLNIGEARPNARLTAEQVIRYRAEGWAGTLDFAHALEESGVKWPTLLVAIRGIQWSYLNDSAPPYMGRLRRSARGEQIASARLTPADVREIRRLRKEDGLYFREIATRFGISPSTAQQVVLRLTWKHID